MPVKEIRTATKTIHSCEITHNTGEIVELSSQCAIGKRLRPSSSYSNDRSPRYLASEILVTKPSLVPPSAGWNGLAVGKSVEVVRPARYMFPKPSSAMSEA